MASFKHVGLHTYRLCTSQRAYACMCEECSSLSAIGIFVLINVSACYHCLFKGKSTFNAGLSMRQESSLTVFQLGLGYSFSINKHRPIQVLHPFFHTKKKSTRSPSYQRKYHFTVTVSPFDKNRGAEITRRPKLRTFTLSTSSLA